MAFFGSFAIFGIEQVDLVNRILVAGFLVAFLGLMGMGLPNIQATTLLMGAQHWNAVYPGATSVGILAFGAQNVVPTLLQYLGGDAERTRRAILAGSLLPLAMYLVWEAVFFGTFPLDLVGNDGNMDVLKALGDSGGPFV
jgi:tyrosine-specific transport protein